jgi:hypothetical protein
MENFYSLVQEQTLDTCLCVCVCVCVCVYIQCVRWYDRWIGKDLEGRARGLIEVLSQNSLRVLKKITKVLGQDSRCPS